MVSLTQFFDRAGLSRLVAWGSSRSQFILGLLQIAAERGLKVELFLHEGTPWQDSGSDQLYRLLTQAVPITWIPREEAASIAARARERAEAWGAVLISEGGAQIESLPGAMTLALDIAAQEAYLKTPLDGIWVDAGSGLTAQALLCGLGYLQHKAHVHIVLMAGSEASFHEGLAAACGWCGEIWGVQPEVLPHFTLHRPPSARSYGATNASVWREIKGRACDSGLILDPIYTAKLSASFRSSADPNATAGAQLLIHSGAVSICLAF